MKFIQIGNNFLINVSKIDFICYRSYLVEIYWEKIYIILVQIEIFIIISQVLLMVMITLYK